MAIVKGVAYWAQVNSLDTKYAPQWKLKLVVDKEEMLKLKALGIKASTETDDDGNVYFFKVFRRYLKNKATGADNPKPQVFDPALKEYKGEIGNGSEVMVKFKPYTWKNKHGSGVGVDLQGIQIVNLVPYESNVDPETETAQIEDTGEEFAIIGESIPETNAKIKNLTEIEKKEREILGLEDEEF